MHTLHTLHNEQLVLVTVGTTKFDQLIRALDDVEVLRMLQSNGYSRLIVQHGQGQYLIRNIHPSPLPDFHVRLEEYVPNLHDLMAQASLVITHCGAGSTFEALMLHVPIIAVPNPILMDNHQVELALRLEKDEYLVQSQPFTKDLIKAVREIRHKSFAKYQSGNPEGIVERIETLFP